MNYIELFAGCGGLSLGLESAGYELVFANELSPMAGETFAYNILDEDLEEGLENSKKTKWLSSNFSLEYTQSRLREDPRTFPEYGKGICDFQTAESLKGGLLIGNIIDINKWLEKKPEDLEQITNGFNAGGVDLVSGGPPCQSFSMAGMRQLSNDRNTLPWEFAKFVEKVQPKFALLENVSGILRPFKSGGKSYYAWFEVAKAFAEIGYVPLCLHINAKFAEVAQNRPRFIMLAVREDVLESLILNKYEDQLFDPSKSFYKNIKKNKLVEYGMLPYFDITKEDDFELFKNSFLKHLITSSEKFTSVQDAIDDLRTTGSRPSKYVQDLNNTFTFDSKYIPIKNHEHRKNNDHVKRRFRLYQILNQVDSKVVTEVKSFLKGNIDELSETTTKEMLNHTFLYYGDIERKFTFREELEDYLFNHRTKKQTQKALKAEMPAPAALSIPDDGCHYHSDEVRTLTVREMARIQSFPDNFVFRSKVTTGGKMRRFEVPQYTQVGNAVPPLLGRALGLCLSELIEREPKKEFEYSKSPDCKISCSTV